METYYDELGRVDYTRESDTESLSNRYINTGYDDQGRVILISDPGSSPYSITGNIFTYDSLGRIASSRHSTDPSSVGSVLYCYGSDCAGSQHNGIFSGAGEVKNGYAVRDQKGVVTVYNYRAYGSPENALLEEIRQEIQPASHYSQVNEKVLVTKFTLTPVGIVTKISQGPENGPVFERIYEPYVVNGSLTHQYKKVTHPEFGSRTTTSFDGVGNPIEVVEFDGSVHTFTYDGKERLISHKTPGNTGTIDSAGTVSYTYYDNDLLHTISAGGSVWTYDYNGNNLLTSGSLTFAGESFDFSYRYDDSLNLDQVTYPGGQVLDYTHNGYGDPLTAGDYVTSASYHPNGTLASMTLGNGEVYSRFLDSRSRVQDITVKSAFDNSAVPVPLSLTYDYTSRGNVESITGYFNEGNGVRSALTNLQYDGLSRLSKATGNWGTGNSAANFSYDVWGNIDKRHVGGVNLDYTYNPQTNLLTSASFSGNTGLNYDRSFNYDGNGNVISDGVKSYRYNHLNQLVTTKSEDGTIQTNSYDGHGHRIRTIVNDGQRTRTTFFVYDPSGTLLHEYDKHSGEARDHIQFDGRTLATRTVHNNLDSDGDGIPDYFERLFGMPVFNAANAANDSDNDGLTDLTEFQLDLIPTSIDSNGDGITDGDEYPDYVSASSGNPAVSTGVILDPVFDYLNND